MYKRIHIQNFKNFKDLELTDLKRVNLIAGRNASGKSALLEAVFLHCGAYNPGLIEAIFASRHFLPNPQSPVRPWHSLFYEFNSSSPIVIDANNPTYGDRKITIEMLDPKKLKERGEFISLPPERRVLIEPVLQGTTGLELTSEGPEGLTYHYLLSYPSGMKQSPTPPPQFLTVWISHETSGAIEASRFSSLEIKGLSALILTELKKIEPRVRKISLVSLDKEQMLFADIGLKEMLPLTFVSDGYTKFTNIIITLLTTKSGVILIDEIENGLHYSILEKVWKTIARVARNFDVQVFATTHSYEMILAAHRAFKKEKAYDFTYHRLDQSQEGVRLVRYSKSEMDVVDEDFFEVR